MSQSRSMFALTTDCFTQDSEAAQELVELSLEQIEPNSAQPRRCFDEVALKALAGSIDERGVLQPVLVRPSNEDKYQLIAGERRWRAAKLVGLQTIPALVSEYDDLAALEVGLIENMAREDLNPIEEARSCATLVKEFGLTYQEIGARVGSNKSAVANLMRLLALSDDILVFLEHGELSEAHGRALLMAKDPDARRELAHKAIEEGWSTRALKVRARESNTGVVRSEKGPEGQGGDSTQARDLAALNVARAWGEVLGVEVEVRPMHSGLRLEVRFDTAEGAIAAAARFGRSGL